MPKSLVHGELVLHSPSVLLPRTARLYAKLTRGLGRVPESFVHKKLVLHSPSVLYAPLPKLARGFGECLNPLFTEYGFCTRLQFCMRVCNLVQARKSILRLFVR